MPRCIFCNKFSFLLNNQNICKNCYFRYTAEAKRVVEQDINALFDMIDAKYNTLEFRKSKLDELKNLYFNFINTPAGKILKIYDYFTFISIKNEIDITELKFDSLFRKKEICKYSKINGAPNDYVVFDLETTGLDNSNDAILEIGAIKYTNGVEVDRFHTYVNPERSIPRSASEINHITAAKVRKAPTIRYALNDFINFIGDLTLIAYNSDFDMGFIQMKCTYKLGKKVENNVIDALPLAQDYLSKLPNKKLETVKKYFNLDVGSHNAIDDCIVTNHLYQYCRQFEELKYRYVIPFGYRERELSDIEIEYLNTIVEICEKNGVPKKDLKMYSASNKFLTIERKNEKVVGLKLFGKLQYILLEIPLTKFQAEYKTELLFTKGSQNEKDCTRVFTKNPSDLWNFEKCIVKKNKWNQN